MSASFKKNVIFALLLVMIASVFTACGKSSTSGTATGSSTNAAQSSQPSLGSLDKKIKLSYYSYWCGDIEEGNWAETQIEKAMNVDIETKKVNHAKKEQVDLMLASGDMPDMGWFDYSTKYMFNDQELTRLIPIDMVKKFAPGFIKTYDKFPIIYKQITSKEDKNQFYGLAGHQAYIAGNQYFFTSFYRKDWLDKFGFKPASPAEEVTPGVFITEKGFTLDQLEQILEKFTKGDPDGNGKDDTVGMIGDKGFTFNWSPMLGAYGLYDSFTVNDNGKAAYYYSTDKYKQFLKYVNGLYKKGYIDKEILTIDSQQFFEKSKKGYGGYFGASANWLGSWANTRPPVVILQSIQGSSILMTPGEIGADGKFGTRMYNATPAQSMLYVNKNVKDDEKLARILQVAEYTCYSSDKIKFVFGEEGVDFKMVDGRPVRPDNYKQGGSRGIFTYNGFVQDEQYLEWINDSLFIKTKKYTLTSSGLWNKYLAKPYRIDLLNETGLADLNIKYATSVSDVVNQFFAAAVTGEVNVDTGWDDYIKKLNTAGYDKIQAELQKAPLYADLIKN